MSTKDIKSEPQKILAVHQGYELYGSDRTFISSLIALRRSFPDAEIRTIIPKDGSLAKALASKGFAFRIEDIWVARKSNGLATTIIRTLLFPLFLLKAINNVSWSDTCYINTSVIFDYTLATRFCRANSFVHVHEIPTGIAMAVISLVLRISNSALIYNSRTTREAFTRLSDTESYVLLNGVDVGPPSPDMSLTDAGPRTQILMIGRLNDWKGQDLLLKAVALLPVAVASAVTITFAGSTFGNSSYEDDLKELAKTLKVAAEVNFQGFVADPAALYATSHIVVVPSKKPEPFGLVAIEAMAHGKPVIAADHGGLTEIVVHQVTGLLFEPNSEADLARSIHALHEDRTRASEMGSAGRQRYFQFFTEDRYQQKLASILRNEQPQDGQTTWKSSK